MKIIKYPGAGWGWRGEGARSGAGESGFPGGAGVKNPAANARDAIDISSILGSG